MPDPLKQTARGTSNDSARDRAQRLEEALVLGAGPVGDPQVAGAPERRARPDGDTRLCQRFHDLALVEVAQVDPGEVGLRVRGLEAHLVELPLYEDPLDHVLFHAVAAAAWGRDGLAG